MEFQLVSKTFSYAAAAALFGAFSRAMSLMFIFFDFIFSENIFVNWICQLKEKIVYTYEKIVIVTFMSVMVIEENVLMR